MFMEMEKDLLERLRLGSEEVFELLYWQYNERIYHFVYSLLYDKLIQSSYNSENFMTKKEIDGHRR